jgi:hypothetical protein
VRVAHLAHLVAVHWKVSASPKLPSATWVMIRVYCHRAGGYCPEAGGENFADDRSRSLVHDIRTALGRGLGSVALLVVMASM